MSLSKFEEDVNIIQALDDEPNDVGGLTSADLKAKFDEAVGLIKTFLNDTLTAEADTALSGKVPATRTVNGHALSDNVSVSKSDVGLGSADNTADADKPLSAEQKAYVDAIAAAFVLGQIPDGTITAAKLAEDVASLFAAKTHADTHKTGGTDAMAAADIGAATKPAIVTVTFPVAGWTQNATTGCYEQTVAVAGLLTTDGKNIRVEPVGSTDADAQALTDAAFAMIDRVSCDTDGQLYARCPDGAPTVAFQAAAVISR